jgi:hypothetical protein
MLRRLANYVVSDRYVYAWVDALGPSNVAQTVTDFSVLMIQKLSVPSPSRASPEVQKAAAEYVSMYRNSVSTDSVIDDCFQFLFSRRYGSPENHQKLIFLIDVFDAVHSKPFSVGLAAAVRSIKNDKTFGAVLPSFQAAVCVGAYNASRLTGCINSPFVEDKVFTHEKLDFTFVECSSLFSQYMDEDDVTIDVIVIKSIHGLTGGHTGLVNACGYAIKEKACHISSASLETLRRTVVEQFCSRKCFVLL